LTLTPSSPLNLSCLSSNPLLNCDKHLGCYSPPPLNESRPKIQGERLSREEKPEIHFPTSAVVLGYLASSIREANLVKTTFWYLIFIVNFCLKNFLHWIPWSIATLGGIQDNSVHHSWNTECTMENKLTTHNIYFSSGHSMYNLLP
jgi:hypothetical protein